MENFFSHTSGVWAQGVVFRVTCPVLFVSCFFAVGLIFFIIPANSHVSGLKTLISRHLTPAGQFLTPD